MEVDMWWTDKKHKQERAMNPATLPQALGIWEKWKWFINS